MIKSSIFLTLMFVCISSSLGLIACSGDEKTEKTVKTENRSKSEYIKYINPSNTYVKIYAGCNIEELCLRNVVYYRCISGMNRSSMSPAFKTDGTLYTCQQ